jgi:DNA polymerase III epsilon subunit family exonuclease
MCEQGLALFFFVDLCRTTISGSRVKRNQYPHLPWKAYTGFVGCSVVLILKNGLRLMLENASQQGNALMISPDAPVIVLDVETTGLDHRTEQIIEIAALKLENGIPVAHFQSLVRPTTIIRHSSFRIHNISEEMVAEAPTIDQVLPGFLEFVGDLPFVAHNAIFDYSFINEAMKTHLDKRFRNLRIDTFEMFRSVFPDEPSHGLSALLAKFGFEPTVKHRAMDDTECLAKTYPRLRSLYEQKFDWQLAQLKNVPYLLERYLRLQRSIQNLQAEMSDLKDVFKLHFLEGGKSLEATTGEMMVSSYKRSYDYDEDQVLPILQDAGLIRKAYKLNSRALDKLLENNHNPLLTEDQREQIRSARRSMHESKQVNFIKPQPELVADSEVPLPE